MIKQVVFLGGIHGSGKTTICASLQDPLPALVIKQRHELISLGIEKCGLGWPEVPTKHQELIPIIADNLISRLQSIKERVLLVDCHYAIRKTKALRLKSGAAFVDYGTPFIHDLDPILALILKKHFQIKLALLCVDAEEATNRISGRPEEVRDFDTTVVGLKELVFYEKYFFDRLGELMDLGQGKTIIIDNNGDFGLARKAIRSFITAT